MNLKEATLYIIKGKGCCDLIKCYDEVCPVYDKCITIIGQYNPSIFNKKIYHFAIQHALKKKYITEQELFDLIL